MTDTAPSAFTFRENEKFRGHERGASLDHQGAARSTTRPVLPIPDLRFEYSYLRSVRPFVKLLRTAALPSTVTKAHGGDEGFESIEKETSENGEQASVTALPKSETLDIQWKRVIWVTARDQFMAPFLQGALWALASFYFSPWSSDVGKKMGSYVRSRVPEGSGAAWLRGLARQLGLSTNSLSP
ncbi:hypothetical protein BKA70DRAFT_1088035 [Coprinopsis sp. MPI-PUGE-AT-0042]|nr:hypothetical protein BKA70DRAFT_1088035 [Coprinopsis sp. MPI-PUGE-AT-0042]